MKMLKTVSLRYNYLVKESVDVVERILKFLSWPTSLNLTNSPNIRFLFLRTENHTVSISYSDILHLPWNQGRFQVLYQKIKTCFIFTSFHHWGPNDCLKANSVTLSKYIHTVNSVLLSLSSFWQPQSGLVLPSSFSFNLTWQSYNWCVQDFNICFHSSRYISVIDYISFSF